MLVLVKQRGQSWFTSQLQCLACRQYARTLGEAFDKRGDLRKIIAQALERLCTQNRQVLQAAGVIPSHSQPPKMASFDEDEDAEVADADDAAEVPDSYTPRVAKGCVWSSRFYKQFCMYCLVPVLLGAWKLLFHVLMVYILVVFAGWECLSASQPTPMKHSCLHRCEGQVLRMYVLSSLVSPSIIW